MNPNTNVSVREQPIDLSSTMFVMSFSDFANRLTTIEDLATRDNVINVPVALPTGYVINRPSQPVGDRVDVNKDGPNKEVRDICCCLTFHRCT